MLLFVFNVLWLLSVFSQYINNYLLHCAPLPFIYIQFFSTASCSKKTHEAGISNNV